MLNYSKLISLALKSGAFSAEIIQTMSNYGEVSKSDIWATIARANQKHEPTPGKPKRQCVKMAKLKK